MTRNRKQKENKAIVKVFKECDLPITIECNLKIPHLLDLTYDFDNKVCKPFRKENNKSIYINKHSNHQPSIFKQLPKSIEKRVSEASSNKDIFDESIKLSKNALKESGFSKTLNYIAPTTDKEKKNRKRKVIWFNPSFSISVKSNIGRTFLRLLTRNHTIYKLFNRNTVKMS